MAAHISCRSLTKIWLQISRWRTKWRPWNAIIGYNSAIYYYRYFVFFTDLCVMTPDINYIRLIQIGLPIPRWRTKWRPCNGMTVSSVYISFKCYSLLHFAVCQLLCWALLVIIVISILICSFPWLLQTDHLLCRLEPCGNKLYLQLKCLLNIPTMNNLICWYILSHDNNYFILCHNDQTNFKKRMA